MPEPGLLKESTIQESILSWLESIGIDAWNVYSGPIVIGKGRMVPNPTCLPDIQGIIPPTGRMLMIEVKRPTHYKELNKKKKARLEKQRQWLKRVNDAGGIGIEATSVEDVYNRLMNEKIVEVPWIERSQPSPSSSAS